MRALTESHVAHDGCENTEDNHLNVRLSPFTSSHSYRCSIAKSNKSFALFIGCTQSFRAYTATCESLLKRSNDKEIVFRFVCVAKRHGWHFSELDTRRHSFLLNSGDLWTKMFDSNFSVWIRSDCVGSLAIHSGGTEIKRLHVRWGVETRLFSTIQRRVRHTHHGHVKHVSRALSSAEARIIISRTKRALRCAGSQQPWIWSKR